MQTLCEKVEFGVRTTIPEAQKSLAQRLAAISKSSVFSAAVMAGPDAFKLEKEAQLYEDGKLNEEFTSRQTNEFTAKLPEVCRTYGADLGVLKERLRKSLEQLDGL